MSEKRLHGKHPEASTPTITDINVQVSGVPVLDNVQASGVPALDWYVWDRTTLYVRLSSSVASHRRPK